MAFSVEALGLKEPLPPLQLPLEAAPPTEPASCTAGLAAHAVWSRPALAVAPWFTCTTMLHVLVCPFFVIVSRMP